MHSCHGYFLTDFKEGKVFQFEVMREGGGYYRIPFTSLKITFVVFNKEFSNLWWVHSLIICNELSPKKKTKKYIILL